ncbi:CHAT domain-containing protein [Thermosynechococcus sichuanensis E542]|uniref:CHAT domain-containing protein n=1 Tax=Thermosynechococcus sichuanensis E542 TaxID=2016101 RepID=A0A7D6J3V5_9CYAN|nr:CHAT domain-containing protein [Thermosynechococcus vestitus]QLL29355.1 CHAT domain-containing protein [Thermosynechococcus vestitus E542]
MKTLQQYLLPIALAFWGLLSSAAYSQITPATNGSGTTVIQNGQQIDISGGSLSGNGQNLFHLFRDFNVRNGQIANFLSNPQIRNILAGVNGGNPSYINGLIQITGGNSNLYLLNPAGIVFGPNARLNLPAAFHASTAQRVLFEGGIFDVNGQNLYQSLSGQPTGFEFLSKGLMINEGELRVGSGQTLSLMAHQVINTGTLAAPAGNIHIATVPETGMVRVSQAGMLLSLEIPQDRLPTAGAIAAVDLPSLLTGNGLQSVNSVIQNPDGTIRLVHDPSKIPLSTNTAVISGSLSVANPIGMGGQITITGQNIALINANLTASGQLGGGTILLGGDYLGGTTGTKRLHSSFNAQNLFINSNSMIAADAFNQGNGGTVIAWADNSTQFAGTITARGGQLSGNGGFVETSGREWLSVWGTVDASAVNGQPGTWLLDPRNVIIYNTTSGGTFSGGNPDIFTPTTDDAFVENTAIEAALNLGTSVIITTGGTGTQAGDISVFAPITKTSGGDASLTLQAANDILVTYDIRSEVGRLNIILHADADNSGAGAIELDSVSLISNGGNIILGGGSDPFTSPAIGVSTAGVTIEDSTLNANGGHIKIHGSGATTDGQAGVLIRESSILTSGSGEITILGTGGSSVYSAVDGIWIQNSLIRAEAGNLTLTGTGGNGLEVFSNIGIGLEESEIQTTTGNITLRGTGGTGFAFNQEGIQSRFTSITSQGGNITLSGTGGESGAGVLFIATTDTDYPAEVRTTGNGNILIEGRGTDGNSGLVMEVSDSLTFAVQDGVLTLAAQGGIEISGDSPSLLDIQSTGAGRLVFQPIDGNTAVGVGDGAAGDLIVDQFLLNQITGVFSLVTIGHPSGTGLIDVRPFSLNYNLALQTPSGSSLGIQFNGSGTTNLNGRNLTLNSGGGVNQGTHAISAGTLQLLGQGTFTLNNANNEFRALSGNVAGNINLDNQGALDIISFNNGVNGLTTGINTNGNTLILRLSNGNLTQSAPIQAGSLGLALQNGSAILTNPNNQVGTLAAQLNSSSDLQFVNNGTLTVGSVNPTGITGRSIFLQTLTGDIVLNAPISAFGVGDAIVLAAENNFINNYGSSVFSTPNGRWLVYSTDPNLNINGGLTGSEQFDTVYPEPALFSGSGFLYRVSQAPPTPPTEPSTPPTPPTEPSTPPTPPTEPSTPPTPPTEPSTPPTPPTEPSTPPTPPTEPSTPPTPPTEPSTPPTPPTEPSTPPTPPTEPSTPPTPPTEPSTPPTPPTEPSTPPTPPTEPSTPPTPPTEPSTPPTPPTEPSTPPTPPTEPSTPPTPPTEPSTPPTPPTEPSTSPTPPTEPSTPPTPPTEPSTSPTPPTEPSTPPTPPTEPSTPPTPPTEPSTSPTPPTEPSTPPTPPTEPSTPPTPPTEPSTPPTPPTEPSTPPTPPTEPSTPPTPPTEPSTSPTPPTEPSTPPTPPTEPSTPPTPPTEPSTPTAPEPQIQENLGRILFGEETKGTQLPQNTAQVVYFPGVEIIRQQISTAFDQGDYNSAIKLLQQLYSFEFSEYFGELLSTPNQEELQFLDIDQIKELLGRMAQETGQKPALSYVFWRPEQLDIFIITPEGEPIYQPVRVSQEAVRRVIAAFNREVRDPTKTNGESYLPFAQQLYQWIMGGVDAELQARGINTLVFALDQGLRSMPMAALHTGSNLVSSAVSDSPMGRNGQFLVERYNLSLIPSINLVDTRYQSLQNASVLAMGASQFTNQSPLPAVPIELQTITQLVGQGRVFLNEAFTVSNLETQRRRSLYPILHLATHGEFNAGKPQNSYIQFWDSQLSMTQLRQLRLFQPPTELMTLSACRTAVGDTNAELGFAGLSLQAGVKSSVASLWYVSDEGTLALMTAFYDQLKTAPIKAEALRQGQLALIRQQVVIEENHLRSAGPRGGLAIPLPQEVQAGGGRQLSHPYFWAGFTMIGSPW